MYFLNSGVKELRSRRTVRKKDSEYTAVVLDRYHPYVTSKRLKQIVKCAHMRLLLFPRGNVATLINHPKQD